MQRRTRWIQWARETSKVRRKVHAQAGIRRAYPKDDLRRWAYLEGFPEGIHFHGETPLSGPQGNWARTFKRDWTRDEVRHWVEGWTRDELHTRISPLMLNDDNPCGTP